MIIDRISESLPLDEWLKINLRKLESTRDSRVNVISLLKINVFEEIPSYSGSRNGVTEHIYPGQVGNCTFHRHQSFSEIFANPRI